MSLDVYLELDKPIKVRKTSGVFIREDGANKMITIDEWNERYPNKEPVLSVLDEVESLEVYSENITHNLSAMAREAGIYQHLWIPDEINIVKAAELIDPLRQGLHNLKIDPNRYIKLNPENGWGNYELLVSFVENYINACYKYPDANVKVSR